MIGLRRALILIATAALAAGLIAVPVILTSDHEPAKVPLLVATLLIGWSFVGTGVYAWWRRPRNEIGVLMVLTGFFWILPALAASDVVWVFALGSFLSPVALGFLVHLLLVFPDGRLRTRLERWVVVTTYVVVTVMQLPGIVFADTQDPDICGPDCPANPLRPENSDFAFVFFSSLQALVGILAIIGLIVALVRRWRRWNESTREAFAPVLWAGGAVFFLEGLLLAENLFVRSDPVEVVIFVATLIPLGAIPYAFLFGLLRTRISRAEQVGELVTTLTRRSESRVDLREAISEALGDPELQIALWVPDRGGYVDSAGRPVAVPDDGDRRTLVEHDGRRIGALVHGTPVEDPETARTLAAAAALNLENQRLEAELRSNLRELRASRRRLVEAGDAERTRVERNLHDGAQQRLVGLALSLRLAGSKLEDDPEAAGELLAEASAELELATTELRELARGIHPAILSDRGLGPALEALTARATLPVELDSGSNGRFPGRVEAAAYYVVAEALTNISRHAGADRATVTVATEGDDLVVAVGDDGKGGADPEGSGLRGLADRVGAADGVLEVEDRPEGGTVVRAVLPIGQDEGQAE